MRLFLSLSVMIAVAGYPSSRVLAVTNEWYPGGSGFTGWPTNWVAVPSLNDPKELAAGDARIDFVGDTLNAGAYWAANSNYFFIRMRVAVSNVTATTFRDSHWIYIDRLDYTNGAAAPNMPDYALVWDSKSNDPTKHGLELMTGTNLAATTYWSQMSLNDIDNSSSTKIAPPDLNTTGDGYVRTIDMRPTTNFGYTTFIDFAVKWSFFSANTALNTNQEWRLQFGSRNDANDHNFPQDDVAGGFSPTSVVATSYSSPIVSRPLSAAIDLSVYATTRGVVIELWTVNESGRDDIVIFAWIDNGWAEVGRVPSEQVVGENSNRYMVQASGLAEGKSYLFKIIDEANHTHITAVPVMVKTVRVGAVRLDPQTMAVTFNTEYGRSYVVQSSPDLVNWTVEHASYATATGMSDSSNEPFMAGPGTQTEVRVPVNGRKQMFFRIVLVE